ncbi:hypothetical protein FACS189494_00080 [Spirochaetia bacterium]|nr:hypothetical protein FACS189494_00080 [Spirochaetia bacterium]
MLIDLPYVSVKGVFSAFVLEAACGLCGVCPLAELPDKSRGAFSSEIGTMMQTLAGSIVKRIALCGLESYW